MAVALGSKRRRLLHLNLRKKLLLMALLILNRNIKRKYSKKRWWVHPIWRNRKTEGHYDTLLKAMRKHDHEYFRNFTRMSPTKFDLLLSLIRPKLLTHSFGRNDIICPELRLALTLRYLATGHNLPSMAYAFRVGITTASNIIKQTCKAIWETLNPIYVPTPTKSTWEKTERDYREKWNHPMCVGAVDGKHVLILKPKKTGSVYHNYKSTNSIVLMAVVDANYKFITVDVGGFGSSSDGGIFKSSAFGKDVQNGKVDFPAPAKLPGTGIIVPHVLVGDEAFQLLPSFMRPFPGANLTNMRRIYNYRLSRARRCSENCFGILVARWRVFTSPIAMKPENADSVVKAAVALHNFLLQEESKDKDSDKVYCPLDFGDHFNSSGQLKEGLWRGEKDANPASGIRNCEATAARNYSIHATEIRTKFAEYFYDKGQVWWQWNIPGLVPPL